jgi:2,5-diketo-D-gluconate reductase A
MLLSLVAVAAAAMGAPRAAVRSVANTTEIAPGVLMPAVSMGHSDSSSSTSQQVAALWLKLGGRGLDTANSYSNQDQIGAAMRASGLPRSEIFVTTKIFCAGNTSGAVAAIDSDLKQLGLESVDLVLIHRPNTYPGHPEQCQDAEQRAATWKGLELALKAGKTRAIGVSNFNASELAALLETAEVTPAVNQCQMSVAAHDDATRAFSQAHGIAYQSYSPFGRDGQFAPRLNFSDPRIVEIARTHGRSAYQVCLRWIVQLQCLVAFSATTLAHDLADKDVFDFELADDEMRVLSSI